MSVAAKMGGAPNGMGVCEVTSTKVMMITTIRELPLAGQIAIALAKVGFEVAAISPPDSVVRTIGSIREQFTFRRRRPNASVARAIEAWCPDLLFCADDDAYRVLHDLYDQASHGAPARQAEQMVRLIAASLGDPAGFAVARRKSEFMALAAAMGLRCPRTIVVPDLAALEREIQSAGMPVVLKADDTCGGDGVRIVGSCEEARVAYRDLATAVRWPTAFRRSVRDVTVRPLLSVALRRQRTVTLQEHICGRPANRALACRNGKVLAAVSVSAVEVMHHNGPATVVRAIDNPEMTATSEALIRRLGMSGFCGFDFVIDAAERAWLLEMNPRVTQVCHIGFPGEASLPAAMFREVARRDPIRDISPAGSRTVGLFPGAWMLSQIDRHGLSGRDDLPDEEPGFVRACLALGKSGGWWHMHANEYHRRQALADDSRAVSRNAGIEARQAPVGAENAEMTV